MKNLALLYSGQIRHFKYCFPTHIQHIIKCNRDYNCYIFAHFWNQNSLYETSCRTDISKVDGVDYDKYSKSNLDSFLSIDPHALLIEHPFIFNTNLKSDTAYYHPIQNILSMFYSMELANSIKNNFSIQRGVNFEWTLRMRTDLYFEKDLDLSTYNNNNLYVDDDAQVQFTDYSTNDIFSFSCNHNMNFFMNTFSNIEILAKQGVLINPECLLGANLMNNKILSKRIKLRHNIYNLYRDKII